MLLTLIGTPLLGASQPIGPQNSLEQVELEVNGIERSFLVSNAVQIEKTRPLVFAFHGHGGTARGFASRMNFSKHWPEAIWVFMQGLPTPGMTDPDGKRNGWQKTIGDIKDRDLQFFEATNSWLTKHRKVDAQSVYVTGHSNGGGFTYLLWNKYPNRFAAIAPTAAGGGAMRGFSVESIKNPVRILHLAGAEDTVVTLTAQKRVFQRIQIELKATALPEDLQSGRPYEALAKHKEVQSLSSFRIPDGGEIHQVIYKGGHNLPSDAAEWIASYFSSVAKKLKEFR